MCTFLEEDLEVKGVVAVILFEWRQGLWQRARCAVAKLEVVLLDVHNEAVVAVARVALCPLYEWLRQRCCMRVRLDCVSSECRRKEERNKYAPFHRRRSSSVMSSAAGALPRGDLLLANLLKKLRFSSSVPDSDVGTCASDVDGTIKEHSERRTYTHTVNKRNK